MKHTRDLFEDIEPHKLHRSGDVETSKAAAYLVPQGYMRKFVLLKVKEAGSRGITGKELTSKYTEYSHSSISSRPNELEKLGLIFYAGDKRENSRVLRHIDYKDSCYEAH